MNRKVPGPTGPAVLVDEAYALALRGRGAAALRLLDDAVDAGGAEPVWPEAYRLARIRILLSLPDPGQQRKGRDLLWQAGETGSWQALLEQARQEHREGEGQAAAATLRRCLRSFGAGSRGEDAEVPALSALLEREAEKITHPVPTAGGADDPGTLSPDLLLRLITFGKALAEETAPQEVLRLVLHEAISETGAGRGFGRDPGRIGGREPESIPDRAAGP